MVRKRSIVALISDSVGRLYEPNIGRSGNQTIAPCLFVMKCQTELPINLVAAVKEINSVKSIASMKTTRLRKKNTLLLQLIFTT